MVRLLLEYLVLSNFEILHQHQVLLVSFFKYGWSIYGIWKLMCIFRMDCVFFCFKFKNNKLLLGKLFEF